MRSVLPLRQCGANDFFPRAATARRGALDWAPRFEAANKPVFEALYAAVRDGTETRRSLEFNGRETYREDLAKELAEIDAQGSFRSLLLPVAAEADVARGLQRSGLPARLSAPFAPPSRAPTRFSFLPPPLDLRHVLAVVYQ